jgi:mannose-6-phosphate isomerase
VSGPAPIPLEPAFHAKIWGSRELDPWFPRSEELIGEVWFAPPPDIPILVKFLFTSDRLSVQVHPGDAYARRHENSAGKTEMWYILRSSPGGEIALGFREPITRAELSRSALSGEIERLLRWMPVQPGEAYFTPAGTVHAIGAGLALCEIQQLSDVTYRLYDYGRPRALHLARAAEVADLGCHAGAVIPQEAGAGRALLVRSEHFVTESWRVDHDVRYDGGGAHLLICLEGRGTMGDAPFQLGQVWYVPEEAVFPLIPDGPVHFLRASIPAHPVR